MGSYFSSFFSSVKENSSSYFTIMGIMLVLGLTPIKGGIPVETVITAGVIFGFFCYKLYQKCKEPYKVSALATLPIIGIAMIIKFASRYIPITGGPILVIKKIINSPLYYIIVAHFIGLSFIATNLTCPKV